ncbi:MAG: phosphotriesterase [Actinomycetota bacterium]|nr:phosphotriesterase [Actinomycetota bacterium]
MSTVETVQGTIDAAEMGVTLIHEHVRFRDEAVAENWPGRYDAAAELEAALTQVNAAKAQGVTFIVDPTAMFGGRDVRFIKRVSDKTGVNLAFCTGIYTYDFLPHYFENRDADQIAEHFVADIEQGTQGTELKAAFLKCAADAAGVTPNVEKVHRACARASLQTGAPIMAHSMPGANTGPRQVQILCEEGVEPGKIQIAHCGDTADVEYIQGLVDSGVYVGLDRYGLDMYLPMDQRNATTAELLRRGHAEQIFISQDHCATIDWFPPEVIEQLRASPAIHNWSFTLIFEEVLPWLREQGVMDDAVFQTIFVANPARWLGR